MRRTSSPPSSRPPPWLTGAAAATAHADSIVYVKQGNLYLTSPTAPRATSSPTTATTPRRPRPTTARSARSTTASSCAWIAAATCSTRRSTRWAPTAAHFGIAGPYEARISPDGTRFAYWFFVQTSWSDYDNNVEWIDTGSYGDVDVRRPLHRPVDRGRVRPQPDPGRVDLQRPRRRHPGLLDEHVDVEARDGPRVHVRRRAVLVRPQDPYDPVWDVTPAHWYDDPSLSHDQSKLAMTGSASEGVDTSVYVAPDARPGVGRRAALRPTTTSTAPRRSPRPRSAATSTRAAPSSTRAGRTTATRSPSAPRTASTR